MNTRGNFRGLSARHASALLFLVFMMAALFTCVITAMLVTAGTQVAVRQAQEMHRSLSDELRVRALVLALVADKFEVAPHSAVPPGAPILPLNEEIQAAVADLQGGGTWSVVTQPLESAYGHFSSFPLTSVDKVSALGASGAVSDYLTPELHALIAGSPAAWTDPVIYRFRRTTERTKDLQLGVRLLTFPLLRAPRLSRGPVQNKIIYWRPNDLRDDLARADPAAGRDKARARFAFWPILARGKPNAETCSVGDTIHLRAVFAAEEEPLRDITASNDLSLLSKYGERTLGTFSDSLSPSALPWLFRQRAALWIHAPEYLFSGEYLNACLTYCGVTHTIDLQAFEALPGSVAALSGVTPGAGSGKMLVDVGALGEGERSVSGRTYRATRDAAVIYSETGGSVTLRDNGAGATSAFVLVFAGPADASAAPLTVTLDGPISRPIILFFYHARLLNPNGPTFVNGALYCDPVSSFVGGAGHELTVASLTYYGGTESSSFWNTVSATAPIPIEIEAIAPRVVLPISRIL